jgi:hypothetical protein
MAQFGSLAMAPIGQLEKMNLESAKRRKLTTQKHRASCSEVHVHVHSYTIVIYMYLTNDGNVVRKIGNLWR